MPPKKRKHLIFEDKKNLIGQKDAGKSIDDLVSSFGVYKTAVYDILKDQKTILGKIDEGIDPKRKHVKIADDPKGDAILSWLKTKRSKNIPVNGPLIQAKAIAKELGDDKTTKNH